MKDRNEIELINGSIIDIHQTVNGQNIFVILDVIKLDVRYGHDLSRIYEYNTKDLLAPGKFNGIVEFEIIGNINDILKKYYSQL